MGTTYDGTTELGMVFLPIYGEIEDGFVIVAYTHYIYIYTLATDPAVELDL